MKTLLFSQRQHYILQNQIKKVNSQYRKFSTDLSKPLITHPGADLSSKLQTKIMTKDQELRQEHLKPTPDEDTKRKRLLWRSKQRGLLEVDLLMGTWAVENIHKLNNNELDQYERIINLETVDMFNLISGRTTDVDPALLGTVLTQIQQFVKDNKLFIMSSPRVYVA